MKIHHCNEHQQETRAVPASTVCLQALRCGGLSSGGRLSSFTIDRRIVPGGSKSLPERRGMQFLESPQMQAHLDWPVCVLQVPSPGGRSGGGQLLPAQPMGIQERPPVPFSRRKSNPLTFGVAKLGVSFVDRKKAL